jgi:hypothetical protein
MILIRQPMALVTAKFSGPNADPVIEATRRMGRLVEVIDGVVATAELHRRAKKAATEVARVGKLTVREGILAMPQ